VIAASLGSLVYPSVTIPVYSTETFVNMSTIVNTSTSVNANTVLTWSSFSVTNLYLNYGACWSSGGGGCFYVITTTVTTLMSTQYTITTSSTNQVTITNEYAYTNELTHTYSQNIPLYVSLGMDVTELVLVAILIVLGGLMISYFQGGIVRRKPSV